MGKLESPNQYGDKGNKGGEAPSAPGGKIVSPNKATAGKEGNGHGEGRSAKGNDGKTPPVWLA